MSADESIEVAWAMPWFVTLEGRPVYLFEVFGVARRERRMAREPGALEEFRRCWGYGRNTQVVDGRRWVGYSNFSPLVGWTG